MASAISPPTTRNRTRPDTMENWSKSPAGSDAISQLRRYLIEIVAFTFEADMAIINAALSQIADNKSILSEAERASLLALAQLIRSISAKVDKAEWPTVPNSDCTMLVDAFAKPAIFLKMRECFVFKLLASYAEHQCGPTEWKMTIVAQQIPWLMRCRSLSGDGLEALGATVRSHIDVVQFAAPNEEVRMLLGEAIINWQKGRRLQGLRTKGKDDDFEFWGLRKALIKQEVGSWWPDSSWMI